MVLKIYNTLTRTKEEFQPLHGNRVQMFVCGPTVYDYPHIGHAKTYLTFDMIANYLAYKGYSVFYLQNITDIDDKMIKRAAELKITVKELAEKYFKIYLEDMAALRIRSVNLFAKATEYIPQIIAQIQTLIEKGYAYEVEGNVYFEVKKFEEFGKLSKQSLKDLIAGVRVEIDERKRNPEDFVLWKKHKEGEPCWQSPWGPGRPGWHIEDTAITLTHFGEQYDIHGGATELIFPHHEAEIAQAECTTGKQPFVKYWVHTGVLNIDGEKMSKSLGNFFTIREVLAKYSADCVRFYLLNQHYRSPVEFSDTALEEAKAALDRLQTTISKLEELIESAPEAVAEAEDKDKKIADYIEDIKQRFIAAMDDDFNTREAFAILFEYTTEINKMIATNQFSKKTLQKMLSFYLEVGGIFGLFEKSAVCDDAFVKKLIELILTVRETVRQKKDYAISDEIRTALAKIGILVEDTEAGVKYRIDRTKKYV